MPFPSVLDFAHLLVAGRVSPGDSVVDATVGNGKDTQFLADLVGPARGHSHCRAIHGHSGGREEAEAVRTCLESLDQMLWAAIAYQFVNRAPNAPELLAVERL